jgi:NitT/TauT family transport system permease protein
MKWLNQIWGVHANPGTSMKWALGLLPFVLLIAIYSYASYVRHAENPQDKLLPTASQMATAAHGAAFKESRRTGEIILWSDTAASLKRLLSGVFIAALIGLTLGVISGVFPGGRAVIHPFLSAVAMVPPLAILPILFISLGVDEVAKIALIVIGLFALIARDIDLSVSALPDEQTTKALTLGAGPMDLVFRVVLPQVLPRLIEAIRLSLGAAWLFLIAAEAITAESGLGYRIFLVRRYLAMDLILPYVIWITLLGFLMDMGLRGVMRLCFPWYVATRS